MNPISYLKKIKIQVDRSLDHAYRKWKGLPRLKRSMITPQLYLGGQYNAVGFNKLKKLGITAIVNMRMHFLKQDDFNILHLPTPDQTAPRMEDLKKGVEFIQREIDKGGKVYIHCREGEGRGPTMIIAYLISTGLTFDDAIKQILAVRTFINPTLSQVERLKEFEKFVQIS